MTNEDLAQRLRTLLFDCEGFDGDAISTARAKALDAYFQRPKSAPDVPKGRAAVISGDVSAMTEAVLAQIVDAFSGGRIAEYPPLNNKDELQAQLESDAVHHMVMGSQNGFLELLAACKEALLLRNGAVKIEAVEKKERRSKRLGNVEPAALGELIGPDQVVDHDYNEDTGELTITVEYKSREFVMRALSMENFIYKKDWHKHTLAGIPVCAEIHHDTRADLTKCFPDKKEMIYKLTEHHTNTRQEKNARDPKGTTGVSDSLDKSQELVEWFEVYCRVEAGDGLDELRRISMSYIDGEILDNSPAPFICIATGTAILNPHRFTGISLYDKLKQTQDMRTGLRRALLDNINATTKNRTAGLNDVVDPDDLSDGRVNSHIGVENTVQDVRQAIMAFQVPDTSANILANLESTARERSELGGAALDMQSAQMQIGGDRMGSQGLDRAYSVAEQLSAYMLKVLASTLIRDVFLIAHATLREYFDEPLPILQNGKWVYVKPSQWPERTEVNIKPGMSPGERQRKIQALDYVIESQTALANNGMDDVLVNIGGYYKALMDRARMAEVQNPQQYYLDPQSPESQQAFQGKKKTAAELDRQKKVLMRHALGLEQLRIAVSKNADDADRQLEYFKAVLESEGVEANIIGKATMELARMQRDGQSRSADAGASASTEAEQISSPDSGETAGRDNQDLEEST